MRFRQINLRKLWLSLLLLVGATAIAVPGIQEIAEGDVAEINGIGYATLQEAVDAAYAGMTGDVTIELIADISGSTVIKQKENLNLTIDGGSSKKTVNGQIFINGKNRSTGSETLTITNLKFTGATGENGFYGDAFIEVPNVKTAGTPYYDSDEPYNYAHNITISNCTFTNTGTNLDVKAFQANSGAGAYNVTLDNVTGSNLHSLTQLSGTTGATFNKCKVTNSDSFININGGAGEYTVSNCTFTSSVSDGYGVRLKSNSSANVTLTNNTFTTAKVVQLGKSDASTGSINIVSGTYNGDVVNQNTGTGTITISGGDFITNSDISTYFSGYSPATNQEINGQWVTTDKALMHTTLAGVTTFKDAADLSALNDGTYTLLKNVTRTQRMAYGTWGNNVTIDLNGHTLTSTVSDYAILMGRAGNESSPRNLNLVSSNGAGTLKVNVPVSSSSAAINVTGKYNNITIGENVTVDGGSVALLGENETLTVNGTIKGGDDFAVVTNGTSTKNATITINDGAVLTSNVTAMYLPGNNGLKATVNGGTITGGDSGIEVRAGELTVNGGTIATTATEYSYTENNSGTTVKGAAIAVVQHNTELPIDAQILRGTVSGLNQIAVVDAQNNNLEGVAVKAKDEFITTTKLPAAFKWASNNDGTSSLAKKDPVARIDDVDYYSLADAIAAVPTDGTEKTITLLADVTENVAVSGGKNIVLDLGGKTVSGGTGIGKGYLTVKNGTLAGTVNIYGSATEVESYNGITVDATATVGGSGWGIILREASGTKAAYGTTIDINGKVNGNVWVMGNIENGNSVINVNSGASIKGDVGVALNGLATVNVAANTTIEGAEVGIEARAGKLNVAGGNIKSTYTEYKVESNGSGTTTYGAAIAVAQHTTGLPIEANITGGTLNGIKTISVADPQGLNYAGVVVTAKDELANAETVVIPESYEWVSDGAGMSKLTPRDPVAKIGETVYYSLADAIAAVPTDGTETTINLLANVSENVSVGDGKNIILDLGEKTLTGYIDLYDSELNVKNGNVAGTVYVNGGPASAEAGYNKFTLAADATITADWGFILYQGSNGNDAYGSVIDINGTVNGTAWVMGNITEGNSVINVNSGAKIEGDVFGLNGLATLNVKDGATIIGAETGIEVRAGNLNVEGGTITSTATEYKVESNGSGTTTTGAAIAVAQHTTGLPISTNITGCTLTGVKTISVADPENGNLAGVTVKVADALANAETVIIPVAYKWVSVGAGMSTLTPRDPVAKIEETVYYSLADAIEAVPANGSEAATITLLADVTENVAVSGGKNIILDLGENTLTGMIDQYDSELNVKNGNVAGTVYVNGGPASAEAGYNKFTLAADATITADFGFVLYQGPNGNDAYGSVIDINGTVNGTAWVMGNITGGNSVINVNSGAKIEGDVFGLNGLATLNVKEGATIIGSETGIEVRAGNLNVEGGTIKSTATEYKVESNGSGTTTTGAAIAVAQHTTKLPINAKILGGTLSGVKTISVADPEGGNYAGVVVTAKDELTVIENNVIPDGYIWESNDDGTSTLKTKEDAGIFELIDGKVYPYLDYTEDKPAASVSYFRTFKNTNWMALYIPFDINDVTQLTDKYEFAKVHMVAYETDDNGVVSSDRIRLYYIPITSGTIYANMPYLIKLKNQGDANKQQEIKVENTTLYHTQNINDNPLICSTTNANYLFKGTYRTNEVTADPNDPSTHFFGVGGGGISYISNNTLSSYRWYIKVDPKDVNYAKPTIEFVMGDEDVTGISNIDYDDMTEIEGYYTVNGIRSDVPVKGMNIVKYKNGKTKKVMIK